MVIYVKNFLEESEETLYNNIRKNLEKGKRVVLDFSNLESVEYAFLNNSLGDIIEEYNFEAIEHRINFLNVVLDIKLAIKEIVKKRNK